MNKTRVGGTLMKIPAAMRARSVLAAAVTIVTVLAAPAFAENAPVDVTIGVSSNSFALGGVRIAEQAGLFTRNGVNLRIVVMDSGNAAITALIAGSAQFAASGPGEALTARARRQPIVIVANIYRGLSASVIIAKSIADKSGVRPDAPLRDRLKVLDGLSVAEPSATSAYVAPVKGAADAAGVTIKLVYMTQPAMVAAIDAGAIQAMVAGAPFWGPVIAKGTGVLWISGPKAEFPADVSPASSSCLQTTESFAKSNPETIRRLKAVMADLALFLQEEPAKAKAALAKAYPQVDAASIDLAFAQDWQNWARPTFTADDIKHEIALLRKNRASIPGLDEVSVEELLRFQ